MTPVKFDMLNSFSVAFGTVGAGSETTEHGSKNAPNPTI